MRRRMAPTPLAGGARGGTATVKAHVSRILAELDLGNRVQIALLAYDAGLLDEHLDDER
ncbi:hypothetical protein SHO565_49300 [Streptomyces sp. HO565]